MSFYVSAVSGMMQVAGSFYLLRSPCWNVSFMELFLAVVLVSSLTKVVLCRTF